MRRSLILNSSFLILHFVPINGLLHLSYCAISVIVQRVHAYRASYPVMEVRTMMYAEVCRVVEHIVLPFVIHNRVMIRATVHRVEDYVLIGIWTEGICCCAVFYLRLMIVERVIGVRQIIYSIAFMHPDSLKKVLNAFNDMHCPIVAYHIIVELYAAHGVLPHKEICLSVIVNEAAWINKVAVADYARSVY